jgi:hypothetical protein
MEDYQIEKGIALPTEKIPRYTKWPFNRMVIGDSFFVSYPSHPIEIIQLFRRIFTVCAKRKARNNETYQVRMLEDGFRVWRVK